MARTEIQVFNSHCRVPSNAPVSLIKLLDASMAYTVAGAENVPAFKSGHWDGREHLFSKIRNQDWYHFPSGLLSGILKSDLAEHFTFSDHRRPPGERREFKWHGKEPREFQLTSRDKAVAERGLVTGRGMLNLPIRSGKTTVAALLIQHWGLKTLFIVPSGLLLYQTVASLKENLGEDAPIGMIGDSHWAPDFITIATIQSIIKHIDRFDRELKRTVDLVLQDEAHHLEGPEWRGPVINIDSIYKIGLSATIFGNKDVANERETIWLQAATGPILHRISMQYLFERGFLLRPHILWYNIDKPVGKKGLWYAPAYKALLEQSEYRNSAIADLAEEATMDKKLHVLIDSGRMAQTIRLYEMLKSRGVKVKTITGKTPMKNRLDIIANFRSGSIQCLVGTVLGEGIDIPELECVINAEGLKSKKSIIQRMRNLTPPVEGAPEKKEVLFIDFDDNTHAKLRAHSTDRLKMYEGTRGFHVSKDLDIGEDGRFHLPLA